MGAENPSHALALVVTDELARCGVTDAVLAPGSRSAALAMALHDDPRIRLHVEVDERSAGFLAIGLARATGRPAPVLVTSGTAVANLHPAVVEADTGQVPLVLLTADRPPELRHTGANQAIDQIAMFGRATRWSVDLGIPEDRPGSAALWRSTVCRAVGAALGAGAPPGPVQVNLGFREPTVPLADDGRSPVASWSSPLHGRAQGRPWITVQRDTAAVPPEAILRDLAGRLLGTERGLIVVGSTPARAEPIHDLATATGWPVLAEATSGVRIISDASVAHGHHLLSHAGFARAHVPDLALRIGRTGLSRAVASHLGAKVPQILLDPHGSWHDPERTISELIVADVELTCAALTTQLGTTASSAWAESWRKADAAARAAIDAVLDADEHPSEPRTARDLAAGLPDGATLVVASSMPIRDLDLVMAPRDGLRLVSNRGASGIDGFVSTTLGVALGSPEGGPTVALAGDLSLLHDANGFLLSPTADHLDVTFVVVDNDGGGIFSFLPQAGFTGSFERVFGTPHGRDLAQLAAFHHLGYVEVAAAADLVPAVLDASAAGGIRLVHVRTDREANVQLHQRLTQAAHAGLDDLA
jgi:2-succinyl-5-enolpyruvyl-6-hydroxy-3-cyclohexene-1-carboxylate synthase